MEIRIQRVVDLDQEVDSLGDYLLVLAVKRDVPDDLQLVQLRGVLQNFENAKFAACCLLSEKNSPTSFRSKMGLIAVDSSQELLHQVKNSS